MRKRIKRLIGGSIRCRRKELGLSRKALSRKTGIRRRKLRRYERGRKSMACQRLLTLSGILDTTPDELCREALQRIENLRKR